MCISIAIHISFEILFQVQVMMIVKRVFALLTTVDSLLHVMSQGQIEVKHFTFTHDLLSNVYIMYLFDIFHFHAL